MQQILTNFSYNWNNINEKTIKQKKILNYFSLRKEESLLIKTFEKFIYCEEIWESLDDKKKSAVVLKNW